MTAALLSRAAARPWVNRAHARPSVYHRMANLRRSQREAGCTTGQSLPSTPGVSPSPLLESCRPAGLFFLISHFPPRLSSALSNCLQYCKLLFCTSALGVLFPPWLEGAGPIAILLAGECPDHQRSSLSHVALEAVPLRNRG